MAKAIIDPRAKDIWNVARVVQASTGFTLGLYLYIYGLFFFEKFGGDGNPLAMSWTTTVFVVGNLVILLFDIPTGALADYIGRHRTVVWSFLFRACFFLLMASLCFLHDARVAFSVAIIAYALFGVGYALFSGALLAWVVDTVRTKQIPGGHGPIITASYGYLFKSQLIGAVLGLWLYLQGLIFTGFVMGLAVCILCALYCAMHMTETEGMAFHGGRIQWGVATRTMVAKVRFGGKVFREHPIVFYLSLLFALFMFLNHVIAYLWPVYMKSNFGFGKLSPLWFVIVIGGIWARNAGAKVLGHWTKRYQTIGRLVPNPLMRTWLVAACLIAALPVIALGWFHDGPSLQLAVFVTTVFGVGITYGFIRPCFETLVNNYIPTSRSQERATVLSMANMMISVCVVLLMVPSGGQSGQGTARGWLIPASALLVAALVGNVLIRRRQRQLGEIATAATGGALDVPVP